MIYLLRKNIKTTRLSNKLEYTKIGPYKIKEKLGPVTFKLDLLRGVRIHLVFYILLLEPAYNNTLLGPSHIDKETQEPLYEVDHIIRHKNINGHSHYLVHWQGYQHLEDIWEPRKNLT
jgi:hypothetical protein